jgi:hypothetical protein
MPNGEPSCQLVGLTEIGLASRSASGADAGPSRRCRKASRVACWSAWRNSAWPRVRRPTPTQALRGDAAGRAESPAGRLGENRRGLAYGARRRRRPFEAMPQGEPSRQLVGLAKIAVASCSASDANAGPSRRCRRRAGSPARRPDGDGPGLAFDVPRRRRPFEAMPQGKPSHQLVGWPKIGVASRSASDADAGPSRRCRTTSRVASWSA